MKIVFKDEIKNSDKLTEEKIINLFLKVRGIKNKQEFLQPTNPAKISLASFGFKQEIKRTLKLLEKIQKEERMIIVYTDYDADGITGGAILWETLYLLGFKVMPYVPHRQHEGYGFSLKGIDFLKKEYNPALIISVDHGITAREKIAYAYKLGIQTIVTDHHLKPEKIPDRAEAIFHIPVLSGSGVAYFFAKEIFAHFQKDDRQLKDHFQADYLSLATIGTIADLVPLIGPSRSIVKYGLDNFSNIKRIGIKQILQEAGIGSRPITPYEVGFIIAPRINAVGRLEHAIDALRLLCTKDLQKATALAQKVGGKNKERQLLVEESLKEAEAVLEKKYPDNQVPKLIILKSDTWHEGIIGLIASKIADKYYRPTIVITKSDGFYKGSARSISSFHITDFLKDLKKYLIDVGGHQQAAGFSIEKERLEEFIKKAEKNADQQIDKKDLVKIIKTDFKIPLSKVNLRLAEAIQKLAPFGIGNPEPTFYSEGKLTNAKIFGKKNEHLKIFIKQENTILEMLYFYKATIFAQIEKDKILKVIYKIEINKWNEQIKPVSIIKAYLNTRLPSRKSFTCSG